MTNLKIYQIDLILIVHSIHKDMMEWIKTDRVQFNYASTVTSSSCLYHLLRNW